MIVKVQTSLFSSDGLKRVLVYNEDRSVFWDGEMDKETEKVLGKKHIKSYWYAEIVDQHIQLVEQAPDQDW